MMGIIGGLYSDTIFKMVLVGAVGIKSYYQYHHLYRWYWLVYLVFFIEVFLWLDL